MTARLRHHLLALYRMAARHRLYAALNVAGLAVGVAVFLTLMLIVRFETSFDRWLPDASRVYRVNSDYTWPGRAMQPAAMSSGAVLTAMRADGHRIVAGARLTTQSLTLSSDEAVGREEVTRADPEIFRVLALPFLAGDPATALAQQDGMVLTQALAAKYFGDGNPIGRTLQVSTGGPAATYRVTGVMADLPVNTHLDIKAVANLTRAMKTSPGIRYWGRAPFYTYVRFPDAAASRAAAADLRGLVQRHARFDGVPGRPVDVLRLSLTALPDIHLADKHRLAAAKPGGDPGVVASLAALGVLVLLIAALNSINLATAHAGVRAKEIALRKVAGATRGQIVGQLLLESVAATAVAALVGLALVELALPLVNALGGWGARTDYAAPEGVLAWLVAIILLVGLGGGLYPALVLSRFEPAQVLASARAPGGGRAHRRLRAVLIAAQFVVAAVFTVSALTVAAQADHLRTADRGFERAGLVLLESSAALGERQGEMLAAIRQVPGVVASARSARRPGQRGGVMQVRGPDQARPVMLSEDLIDSGYFDTWRTRLLAGRVFRQGEATDDAGGCCPPKNPGANVVLGAAAARALGFSSAKDAVGRTIHTDPMGPSGEIASTVIGVIADVHLSAPQNPTPPVFYRYTSSLIGAPAALRLSAPAEEVLPRIEAVWRRRAPAMPFVAETAEEALAPFYRAETRQGRLLAIVAVLAVGLACVGLYGLAASNAARRFKEIGIRKTMGASSIAVARELMADLLAPILIANLVAWPVAYLAMRAWLAGFDQRIALTPAPFVIATVLTLAVAAATVLAQSLKLARAEPAAALRRE